MKPLIQDPPPAPGVWLFNIFLAVIEGRSGFLEPSGEFHYGQSAAGLFTRTRVASLASLSWALAKLRFYSHLRRRNLRR
jgi:hypothetical protein